MFLLLTARRGMWNQSILTEVKQLEGLLETQQPPSGKIFFRAVFCSFEVESLKANGSGTVWQAVLQLDQQWLAALFLTKCCKHCLQHFVVQSLSHRTVLRGRILQAWHQPVRLPYCPNLKLLQHCKSQCYSLPLKNRSQSSVFPNQGTWTHPDLAAAQLADESASRNKRSGTRKRLSPSPIVAPLSLQIHFETTLNCFKSVLLT